MLFIGSGGMAKEAAAIFIHNDPTFRDLYFFDNTETAPENVFGQFKVYRTFDEVKQHFETRSPLFISAIANPLLRKRLSDKFKSLGGELGNAISDHSAISAYTNIGKGVVIQPGCIVSTEVRLGEGVFLNGNAILGHDCEIGDYVSLGPGCRVLGNARIGECSYIGCNSVIMPGVRIGKMVRIGVGKIMDKDVPDNSKIV